MHRLLFAAALWLASLVPAAAAPIHWQPWSQQAFDQAKREHKLVILDVVAVWCHWCHVMDVTTYDDARVQSIIGSHYVALRVDQDSRPDISNRYEDWGWPATIIFNGDGAELVKFAGYIPPERMISLLRATVQDPTPGPSVVRETTPHFPAEGTLTDDQRKDAMDRYTFRYDRKLGAWSNIQKFLDADSVEYALAVAHSGEAQNGLTPEQAHHMADQTLAAQVQLIDPVWGGVYQYSDSGDWKHPHYEKLMAFQSNNLRVYSLAAKQDHTPRDLKAARHIASYMLNFLRGPEGAFYVSQDADLIDGKHSTDYFALDDAARRKQGIPRIDKHEYARENGWAIRGLVAWYEASGDHPALTAALKAADWVVANRALDGGGFRHGDHDVAGPFLGDTLAMGEAFLDLYQATADRQWLDRATAAGQYIDATFPRQDGPGYLSAVTHGTDAPVLETDENLHVARFTNLLFRLTGDPRWQQMRTRAMRYAAAPEIAGHTNPGALLLTDFQLTTEPIHITVIGSRDDGTAAALYQEALAYPSWYRRIEWVDADHPAVQKDVDYPQLDHAAAFVCSGNACSTPAFTVDKLEELLRKR